MLEISRLRTSRRSLIKPTPDSHLPVVAKHAAHHSARSSAPSPPHVRGRPAAHPRARPAHEQRDRCHERTKGEGALWRVLGAPGPAESTACCMRIMPICVLYVGVAWSTYTAVPHHDMSACANADPCHQRVGAASSAQSGCATHHLTSLPNCSLPSNCWHRSI